MKSNLPYICYEQDIQVLRDLGDGYFLIRKKGEQRSNSYVWVRGYYVQTRLPQDKFRALKK